MATSLDAIQSAFGGDDRGIDTPPAPTPTPAAPEVSGPPANVPASAPPDAQPQPARPAPAPPVQPQERAEAPGEHFRNLSHALKGAVLAVLAGGKDVLGHVGGNKTIDGYDVDETGKMTPRYRGRCGGWSSADWNGNRACRTTRRGPWCS